ncbi:MAG: sigma-70 family RNA polymerase sigma factor [bacterium]
MRAAQAGDQAMYRELLLDLGPLLGRFLRRWTNEPQDLDDLTQDTLIAMHRARHTFDPSRPLEPWLFAIARHVAADHLRRRAARLAHELPVERLPDVAAPDQDGSAMRGLEDALARLPPNQREAFELLKLEGLSVEAGALRAGTTTGALKVRAHRAYRALKAMLRG